MCKKANPIAVRFTYEETEQIKQEARIKGKSVSELIRVKVFQKQNNNNILDILIYLMFHAVPTNEMEKLFNIKKTSELKDLIPNNIKKILEDFFIK